MFGLKKWSEKRRLEREDTERRNGYDFAAGRLLRKASTVESLRDESDAMMWAGPFDKGVNEAIRDWENREAGHGQVSSESEVDEDQERVYEDEA